MTYQPYPAPAAPKKSNAWKWVLAVVLGLLLLCGGGAVACTTIFAKGVNDSVDATNQQASARASANASTCTGKTYPDQQVDNDQCADPGKPITLNKVAVTASPLKHIHGGLCTDVTYRNGSDGTIPFNMFDWKLQLPTGEVKDGWDSGTATNPLGSGDLIAGGVKTGSLCFETATTGQHVLIYKPGFWNDSRGIWLNTV
jgi:hypothetical protein